MRPGSLSTRAISTSRGIEALRTTIAFLGAALLAVTITACATWQPFYEPPVTAADAAPTIAGSPTPTPTAVPSPSVTPIPAATPATTRHRDPPASKAAATPGLVTDSPPGQRDAAAKSVEEVSAAIGRIDRGSLGEADAENYDLAVNLLAGARESLAQEQYEAATSLSHKASVLLGTITGR